MRQELFEELAYYCLGKVVDTIVVLVLSSNWPWGSVGNNRPGYDSFLSGMEKMMTIILDLLAMLEVVPNR